MGYVSSYESHFARLEQAASPSRPLAPPTVFDGAEHDSALRMGKFSFHSAQFGPLGELPAAADGGGRRELCLSAAALSASPAPCSRCIWTHYTYRSLHSVVGGPPVHAVLTWQRRHVGADGRRRRWCCLLLAASIRVHLDHFALVHFVRHIPCGQVHVLEAWEQQCAAADASCQAGLARLEELPSLPHTPVHTPWCH